MADVDDRAPLPRRTSRRTERAVDCDKCTHFGGRQTWSKIEWRCARGHPPESTTTLSRRKGCDDYCAAGRDDLIFRRFKDQASYYGDEVLRNRQATARRTASNLAKSLQEFGDMLDGEQLRAGREAVNALNRLADDIERAGRMAKAFKAREDAQRAAEHARKLEALAGELLSGWSTEQIIECAAHLAAFDTSEGRRWLDQRRNRSVLVDSGMWEPNQVAQRMKRSSSDAERQKLMRELRGLVAQALQTLYKPLASDYATRADFEAFQQLQRHRAAAKTAVHALIADVTRGPGVGDAGSSSTT